LREAVLRAIPQLRGAYGTVIMDTRQMGDNFGIGLSDEDIAARLQQCAQRLVVFDDPVRYRCWLRRSKSNRYTVVPGSPILAGRRTANRLSTQATHAGHMTFAVDYRQTGRVIATVFQTT
jgi:hypothetical protein